MRRFLLLISAFCLAALNPAAAHHNWLRLISPEACGDAAVLVACFGHQLPFGERPSAVEDFEELIILTPDGRKQPVSRLAPLGVASIATIDFSEPGLWGAAGWREHYGCQTTEGYKSGHRREVEAQGFKVTQCKHTFRHSKTYTQAGPSGKAGRLEVGHGLELIPDASITRLKAGDTLKLAVRLDGQLQPGMVVSGTREGSSEELAHPEEREKFLVSGTTDEQGRVSLRLEEEGWWFFIAEVVVDNPEPGVDKLYRSATLTLYVNPK